MPAPTVRIKRMMMSKYDGPASFYLMGNASDVLVGQGEANGAQFDRVTMQRGGTFAGDGVVKFRLYANEAIQQTTSLAALDSRVVDPEHNADEANITNNDNNGLRFGIEVPSKKAVAITTFTILPGDLVFDGISGGNEIWRFRLDDALPINKGAAWLEFVDTFATPVLNPVGSFTVQIGGHTAEIRVSTLGSEPGVSLSKEKWGPSGESFAQQLNVYFKTAVGQKPTTGSFLVKWYEYDPVVVAANESLTLRVQLDSQA